MIKFDDADEAEFWMNAAADWTARHTEDCSPELGARRAALYADELLVEFRKRVDDS